LLQKVHLIANVVTHLNGFVVIDLKFFPASILKNGSARFVSALNLLAPFLMFFDLREEDKLFASMAYNFDNLKKLLKNVRARPNSKNSRTLKGTIFLPTRNALFTEKLPAVVAFHGILKDF
jgi:hypothetical protein